MVALINEMRQQARVDGHGKLRHELVTIEELVRLESLSRYIHEANGGVGMVRAVPTLLMFDGD